MFNISPLLRVPPTEYLFKIDKFSNLALSLLTDVVLVDSIELLIILYRLVVPLLYLIRLTAAT